MRKFFPLLMGILLLAAGVFAQSQATTGNIEGRIVDPQGAAVPNVSVVRTRARKKPLSRATKAISSCCSFRPELTL